MRAFNGGDVWLIDHVGVSTLSHEDQGVHVYIVYKHARMCVCVLRLCTCDYVCTCVFRTAEFIFKIIFQTLITYLE